jgi:phage terminase small subunit
MKELALINRYHQTQERPKPPVEQRVKAMDTLDKKMQTILEREVLSADERLKLYDQSFTRYLNVYDDYRPRPVAVAPEPVKKDLIDNEILESVPKTMKAKVQLLLKKMKSSPDISLNEKQELKYKGETVQGSNVVDLVNDVLSKRQYFNPQGWVTFGEALREGNVPQDSIGHEDCWIYITQTKRTPRSRKRQQSTSPIIPYSRKTPRNRKKEVQNWVDFSNGG